jgi:hypothetical protein
MSSQTRRTQRGSKPDASTPTLSATKARPRGGPTWVLLAPVRERARQSADHHNEGTRDGNSARRARRSGSGGGPRGSAGRGCPRPRRRGGADRGRSRGGKPPAASLPAPGSETRSVATRSRRTDALERRAERGPTGRRRAGGACARRGSPETRAEEKAKPLVDQQLVALGEGRGGVPLRQLRQGFRTGHARKGSTFDKSFRSRRAPTNARAISY